MKNKDTLLYKKNKITTFDYIKFTFIILLFSLNIYAQKTSEANIIIQTGHYDQIQDLAFSPDDKFLTTVSKDKKAKIWDITSGLEFRTLTGHKREIKSVAYSPDGKTIFTGGDGMDKELIFWNAKNGQKLFNKEKAHSYGIETMTVSPDGKLLATGSSREFKMWNITARKVIYEFNAIRKVYDKMEIKHTVKSIAFSVDNQIFAIGIADGTIQIRKTSDGELITTINTKPVKGGVEALIFDKQAKTLYSSGSHNNIVQWNVKSGKLIKSMKSFGYSSPKPCYFTPNAKYFYLLSTRGYTKVNIKTEQQEYQIKDLFKYTETFAISNDGLTVAVTGHDSNDNTSIILCDAKTGKPIKKMIGFRGTILSLEFSQNNFSIASGNYGKPARVWNLTNTKGFINYTEGTNYKRGNIKSTIKFNNNSTKLINGTNNGLLIWDIETQKLQDKLIRGQTPNNENISLSKNGNLVAFNQNIIKIYDINTHQELQNLKKPNLSTQNVLFGNAGEVLYSGGYKELKRWSTDDYTELEPFNSTHYFKSIATSPDGKLLATQENIRIYIRNAKNGEIIKKITDKGKYPRFSANGKYLATLWDNTVFLWNTTTYTLERTIKGHTDNVNTIAFSPDNRFIATGSNDTSIKLWDLETGQLVVSCIGLDLDDYIIVTPDNYYMTTKNGPRWIAFRGENEIFPFEQFDLKYNRPDIVLKRIGYTTDNVIKAYKKAYIKRLNKMNFSEEMLGSDFHIPKIKIINKNTIPTQTDERELLLNVIANDNKYNLDRINVWINDVAIYGTNGINLREKNINKTNEKLNLILSKGINKIQISTLNQKGAESLKSTLFVNFTGGEPKNDLYIVAIGISDYGNKDFNLKYAAKDANDLVTTFELQKDKYSNTNFVKLFNKDATKENILKVKDLLQKSNVDDQVILFAAGHGLLDSELDYYFATVNIDFSNPSVKGLPYDELEGIMDGIPARKKIVLIDACHSGEVDKEEIKLAIQTASKSKKIRFRGFKPLISTKTSPGIGLKNSFELMQEVFTDLRRGSGATVISSASGGEFALEGDEWNNGVFTYSVLEGLTTNNADANKDNKIVVSELKDYVMRKVQKLTNGQQHPTSRRENLEFDFKIW